MTDTEAEAAWEARERAYHASAEYADYCRRFDAAVAATLEDGRRAVQAAREAA